MATNELEEKTRCLRGMPPSPLQSSHFNTDKLGAVGIIPFFSGKSSLSHSSMGVEMNRRFAFGSRFAWLSFVATVLSTQKLTGNVIVATQNDRGGAAELAVC